MEPPALKLKDEVQPDYRTSATLLDSNGQPLANVHVNLSPAKATGDFLLPPSANADRVLAATHLQTADGKRFQVTDLKRNTVYQTIGPDQPFFEFHFQPV